MNLSQCLAFTQQTARDAGSVILQHFRHVSVSYKADGSPVTDADKASEALIRSQLLGKYPFPFLSEECGFVAAPNRDYVWMVDPLDGTKSFVEKSEDFSVLIGLLYQGQPVLGVVYQPAREVCYFALRGGGAFQQSGTEMPYRINVSQTEDIHRMSVMVTRFHLDDSYDHILSALGVAHVTQRGSGGLKSVLVAAGEVDCYFATSTAMCCWDVCAPSVIVSEAGGVLTDIFGSSIVLDPQKPSLGSGVVVSNGRCHDEIIKIIRSVAR